MKEKTNLINPSWEDSEFDQQIAMVKELLQLISSENQEFLEKGMDASKIIDGLEEQHIQQRELTKRLAAVSVESAELFVELEEKNKRLAVVSAESAELLAELEEKNGALNLVNKELAKANVYAAELMGEIEVKSKKIEELNKALARANAQASELVAELELHKEEIKKNKERFELLFNSGNDMIFVHSLEEDGQPGKIIEMNEIASKKLGYSKEEFLNLTILDLKVDDKNAEKNDHGEQLKYEKQALFESNLKTKNGQSIPVEVNTHSFEFQNQPMVLGIARDITKRKLAQNRLNETMAELERSNQELEQFAYVASHDLKEPLRMIFSYLELLEKRYVGKLDDRADEYIKFAIDGAHRMQRLIKDLLEYSKVCTCGKELNSTNTEDILNQVLSDLGLMISDSGAKVTHDSLPLIKADSIQMGQVFQNLVGNAIKFNSKNSPQVHVSVEKLENEWLFSVRDNGIGMNPEFQKRAFKIFERGDTQAKYQGTGIGLAVVKHIVERHNGRIWFESKPGLGTTFYFTIPEKEGFIDV